ncbi:MAG: SNF2-related protein, partial [Candidatus Tectimicrobiota bacterium]
MQALFEAIREACTPREWSRGVELGRGGAVVLEQGGPDEILLRIASRAGMTSPRVTLWPKEQDWACDCVTQEEVCAHVAAAVITLHRAQQEGRQVPGLDTTAGRLRYRFRRTPAGLMFERLVVHAGQEQPLEGSLAHQAEGRAPGPRLVTTQADLAVELALGVRRRGPLSREVLPRLLTALARCQDVQLEEVPIKTLGMPLGARACLVDEGDGFRLFVEPEMPITARLPHNLVLCGDTLRLLGETGLTARERAILPQGQHFASSEALSLLTEVLPDLRKRLPVEIRTQRLPRLEAVPPRLVLEVERLEDTLTVLPTLVYGDPPTARVDAGQLVPLGGGLPRRDEAAERRLVQHLGRTLGLAPGHKKPFVGEEAVHFAARLASWNGGELRGNAHKTFVVTAPLVPQMRFEDDTLQVWFSSAAPTAAGRQESRRVSAAAVLQAWDRGATLVPLAEDGWAPLPQAWLQRFGHRVADLLAARQANGTLPRCALPELARLYDALEQPRPPACTGLATLLDDFQGIPVTPLPATLRATLRPYQHLGASWLAFLRQAGLGAMLADDMGLGKTLQALAMLQGHTLVIAPTSVLYHWADEVQRFRPDLRLAVYHGPQRRLDPEADVTLSTYALLRLDADLLTHTTWDTVILDEAQAIKNPESQVAQAAYRLQAQFRLALTGTPMENRLEELWSQFHFLNRGLLGGRQEFEQRYARPIGEGRPEALERLREKLKPFVLRRRKREVAPELPPRTEAVVPCELSDSERLVYDTIRAATLPQVVALLEAGGSVMAALEALLRLRQACCHPGLVPGQVAATSTKVALLVERLEEAVADGHKALVFSQWTALLDRIEPHLRTARLPFTRLDGSTRERAGVVRRFQTADGPPRMLVSLRAGGTGLTLTAADLVCLL